MIEFDELLAVAYKKERMQSRRLVRSAAFSEHAALVRTLEKAAGGQSLRELVDARRAAHARAADAERVRKLQRANRPAQRPPSEPRAEHPHAWIGWFDGSALPNPGRIGIGAVLKSPNGATLEITASAGHGDSSAAEYLALTALLEAAQREGASSLTVHGDSRVVIDDVHAADGACIRALAHHAARVRELIAQIGEVRLQWIPRARNAHADRLSRQALAVAAAPDCAVSAA
ncbi:ribonuclease HI family protein [Caballeronia sp. LZ062]|uniref:ribonuclease HI family protein n=1 Tax=unclassified Caballeronia TaxID=2646786 RepID=UPI00285C9640|nr:MULTISPECIES: ribonuclease HI family protein [unclassified Caballeronia]MDR5854223.1 ribonuclease HI family protein [Caballeronia sp. LZ050]MDR5871246.1 ribonuclease HI family protein [Caballeronia sp. LZ062]